MESKAWIIVCLLLAASFETLMAHSERDKLRHGSEVIQLLKELKSLESNLTCKGKQRWPELLGVPANLAKERIEKDNSLIVNIQTVLNGSPVTADFSCFRVRLAVNVLNIVVQEPVVT
ncbi:unnamed protein product [Withania somnifera]